MNQPIIFYCYDAYCGWCYGFSKVMIQTEKEYNNKLQFEVLSGGMIPADNPRHIKATAYYISKEYKNVEILAGVQFGEEYLCHIFHPDEIDW